MYLSIQYEILLNHTHTSAVSIHSPLNSAEFELLYSIGATVSFSEGGIQSAVNTMFCCIQIRISKFKPHTDPKRYTAAQFNHCLPPRHRRSCFYRTYDGLYTANPDSDFHRDACVSGPSRARLSGLRSAPDALKKFGKHDGLKDGHSMIDLGQFRRRTKGRSVLGRVNAEGSTLTLCLNWRIGTLRRRREKVEKSVPAGR